MDKILPSWGGRLLKITDRFTQGTVSGLIAGIVANILNHIFNFFNLSRFRWMDWMSTIIFHRIPQNLGEAAFAQVIQLAFTCGLGIIYAFMIAKVTSANNSLRVSCSVYSYG